MLNTLAEAKQFVEEHDPDVLVAFEFTGALLTELLRRGYRAISVDRCAALHIGPHFQGDVQNLAPLRQWRIIFFTGPPCFQGMALDRYLPDKIKDGRAWWHMALVVWCFCCKHASAILMEQPNTIANTYLSEGRGLPRTSRRRG